jgi:hypothetical protein
MKEQQLDKRASDKKEEVMVKHALKFWNTKKISTQISRD